METTQTHTHIVYVRETRDHMPSACIVYQVREDDVIWSISTRHYTRPDVPVRPEDLEAKQKAEEVKPRVPREPGKRGRGNKPAPNYQFKKSVGRQHALELLSAGKVMEMPRDLDSGTYETLTDVLAAVAACAENKEINLSRRTQNALDEMIVERIEGEFEPEEEKFEPKEENVDVD